MKSQTDTPATEGFLPELSLAENLLLRVRKSEKDRAQVLHVAVDILEREGHDKLADSVRRRIAVEQHNIEL